ncbi:MAG: CoA transferase [Phenylobacterium sp.]|uniref:CoA transferase n=1 Tax=Phenylobacterium sp. TaxID=1871053 RepID=UPI002734DA43|nr:CoA transferase [Phenylobacterium sp.]MDP3174991.1 CoA transferase [Phenylobacterium sp.]
MHRLRNGVGSHVDVAMADSMMTLVGMQIQQAQHDALWPSGGFPSYATKDGYVNIPLVSPITYRQALKVMGRDDILSDPEFQTSPATRRVEIIEALRNWAAEHTSEESDTIMTAAGVPCAIYRMPHEVLDHPQTVARGSFTDVPTANGSFKILNPPFQISGAGVKAGTTVPTLGEHTHDVLADILGLSEADLAAAAGEKAFG